MLRQTLCSAQPIVAVHLRGSVLLQVTAEGDIIHFDSISGAAVESFPLLRDGASSAATATAAGESHKLQVKDAAFNSTGQQLALALNDNSLRIQTLLHHTQPSGPPIITQRLLHLAIASPTPPSPLILISPCLSSPWLPFCGFVLANISGGNSGA